MNQIDVLKISPSPLSEGFGEVEPQILPAGQASNFGMHTIPSPISP
jgi:hypothetical protein